MRTLLILLLCVVHAKTLNLDHTSHNEVEAFVNDVIEYIADEKIDEVSDQDTEISDEWDIDEKAHTDKIAKSMGASVTGGDELLTPQQAAAIARANKNGMSKRTASVQPFQLWPKGSNGRVRIPYVVKVGWWLFPRSETKGNIKKTIRKLKQNTCIDWVPKKSSDKNYVLMDDEKKGCFSYVGRIGGKQLLNLGKGCTTERITDHEMMHAMGFFHAQNRPDRDKYINIFTQNIKKGDENNFKKQPYAKTYGLPWDWDSVMMYGSKHAASPAYANTMLKKDGSQIRAPRKYSSQDYLILNKAYNC